MQRRSFLTLLGAATAAIAVPERTRSYFFGGWPSLTPLDLRTNVLDAGMTTLSHGELSEEQIAHFTESWDAERLRALVEQLEQRIISMDAAVEALGLEDPSSSGFLTAVWNDSVMQAVQMQLPLTRLAESYGFNPNYRYSNVDPHVIFPSWEMGKLVSVRHLASLEKGRDSD